MMMMKMLMVRVCDRLQHCRVLVGRVGRLSRSSSAGDRVRLCVKEVFQPSVFDQFAACHCHVVILKSTRIITKLFLRMSNFSYTVAVWRNW